MHRHHAPWMQCSVVVALFNYYYYYDRVLEWLLPYLFIYFVPFFLFFC